MTGALGMFHSDECQPKTEKGTFLDVHFESLLGFLGIKSVKVIRDPLKISH